MVKFGRHIQFYNESENPNNHYIVAYKSLCQKIPHYSSLSKSTRNLKDDVSISEDSKKTWQSTTFCIKSCLLFDKNLDSTEEFKKAWREELKKASQDFAKRSHSSLKTVYEGVSSFPKARGGNLETVLRMYIPSVGIDASHDLLVFLRGLRSTAHLNSEALRKSVKKFDKYSDESLSTLSTVLLPELYGSLLISGEYSTETIIDLIRGLLEDISDVTDLSDDESGVSTNGDSLGKNETTMRLTEHKFLTEYATRISPEYMPAIVAHRGFHDAFDKTGVRPLENSLAAFEAAWSNGFHACECDVAMTRDEKVILAHDENFLRLALDPSSKQSNERVQNLTYKELIGLTLKNGVRPPLLLDVLRSAYEIGDHAKIIIEIKAGSKEVFTAVARLLGKYPSLISHVGAIMSFDLWAMHKLRSDLETILITGDLNKSFRQSMKSPDTFQRGFRSSIELHKTLRFNAATMKAVFNEIPDIPDLFLLTVATPPEKNFELWLDIADLSPADGWLTNNNGSLDGIYLRYQPEMMEPDGTAALRALSERFKVGIWLMRDEDPDNYQTVQHLVREGGVTYVNTDAPKDF